MYCELKAWQSYVPNKETPYILCFHKPWNCLVFFFYLRHAYKLQDTCNAAIVFDYTTSNDCVSIYNKTILCNSICSKFLIQKCTRKHFEQDGMNFKCLNFECLNLFITRNENVKTHQIPWLDLVAMVTNYTMTTLQPFFSSSSFIYSFTAIIFIQAST